MAKTSPLQFAREVRQEVGKVTWITPRETATLTGMVFLMIFVSAAFFFGVDQGLSAVVRWVLSLGAAAV